MKKINFTGIKSESRIAFISNLVVSSKDRNIIIVLPDTENINTFVNELNLYISLIKAVNEIKVTAYNKFEANTPQTIKEALNLITEINDLKNTKICIVANSESLKQNLPTKEELLKKSLNLTINSKQSFKKINKLLSNDFNYKSQQTCNKPGEFSVRGGILDIFPVNSEFPYRLDFFADKLDGIRVYEPYSQKSIKNANEITIISKNILDSNTHTVIDLLGNNSTGLILSEPQDLIIQKKIIYSIKWIFGVSEFEVDNEFISKSDSQKIYIVPVKSPNGIGIIQKSLKYLKKEKLPKLNLIVNSKGKNQFLKNIENDNNSIFKINISLLKIYKSFIILPTPNIKSLKNGYIQISESCFHNDEFRRHKLSSKNAPIESQIFNSLNFSKLKRGDFLVHIQHGICRYNNISEIKVKNSTTEVISIEFANRIMIYLPLRDSYLLSRYLAFSKKSPKLSKIGSKSWFKIRTQAEQATFDYASKLMETSAQRKEAKGFKFPPDNVWQKEFENSFPYKETKDQINSINEIKKDMECNQPMDRLLCGDVGYGKTEVAIRACFKAAMAEKQICILVPTTILSHQHYHTFKKRMSEFPIIIDTLSSFSTRKKNNEVIHALRNGKVDIVIGTHRLLSNDVIFKNLGLLIIDEEQKFGVKQKEKIKELAVGIDILTITATPIPRTLQLSISGIKSLSIIDTPPVNRKPIQTKIKSYDFNTIIEAINFEYKRKGQTFYLYNKVKSINIVHKKLKKCLPKLNIEVAHGQMETGSLENIMIDFIDGKIDVLICTTIIESGLDIPNCNTLIIEGAENFGLSQLYQIRGRVGRFNKQSYAYLFLHKNSQLIKTAKEKLGILEEYNELGAGYKIAMRDLELRGAGNILGAEQSGHINGIGFDLYSQLLKESVSRIKNNDGSSDIFCDIKLSFVLFAELSNGNKNTNTHAYAIINKSYINESNLRIYYNRILSLAKNASDLGKIKEEIQSKYGKFTNEMSNLYLFHKIRLISQKKGFSLIKNNENKLLCEYSNKGNKYYKIGSRFPRLTKSNPKLRLKEVFNLINNIKN